MLLQNKIYLASILYACGALFMVLYPPRNYLLSGPQKINLRSSSTLKYREYVNPKSLHVIINDMASENKIAARMVNLKPKTTGNHGILALELKRDTFLKKPGILILGALNGMAWAVPNAILELADRLLSDSNYQTPFFNDYDWYLIPMGNPDGINLTQSLRNKPPLHEEVWSQNITVRQNTRPSHWYKNIDHDKIEDESDNHCFGTNINRNFAYHWRDDVHTSKPNRCCQFYAGLKPFSTAEAKAIRKYVDKLGSTIQLAIYLHASYIPKKEFILYPWRYSLRQPSNYKTLQDIGEYAARKSKFPDGRLYEVHQGSSDERAAGTFSDYMSGVVGTDLVFIVKPYHEIYPRFDDVKFLDNFVKKSLETILSLIRGWRSSIKQDTLWFFGKEVQF